ncbi:hypothetical protein AXK11_04350 [Cephaloticoccus primus]|uniref:Lipopolysaccharide heptosyltransferase I n=1 Tax=Cephaloticoccus primus TaxID=1548207 RepID=A0A139SPW6_9BACT|nr:glycosyltransferase family 9 protein [Cephaloticoccus primus]KXU36583.1 hypothetical protein AXK11_04350 [Cephaloticoccus primus]
MTELLIIKPSSLGDIVHALQVATSLKAQRPDLRISWIAREIFAPLVHACAAVDHVYTFERKGGLSGFSRLMRELRKTKFDYVFDMQGLLRTGLMASRSVAQRKVGRWDSREFAGLFYDEKIALPPAGEGAHAIDILLQFCPILGARPELAGDLVFRASETLHPGFAPSAASGKLRPPVLMFPDSRRAEKKWGGFLQLTQHLLFGDRLHRRVIWAGDKYIPDREGLPGDRFLNLTGNTGLVSLPELIRRSDWVVSNDSGPMHLGAALGVKTLGIFGPTDPARYGPYPLTRPTNLVVRAPALSLISAKEVYGRMQAAELRLAQSGGQ